MLFLLIINQIKSNQIKLLYHILIIVDHFPWSTTFLNWFPIHFEVDFCHNNCFLLLHWYSWKMNFFWPPDIFFHVLIVTFAMFISLSLFLLPICIIPCRGQCPVCFTVIMYMCIQLETRLLSSSFLRTSWWVSQSLVRHCCYIHSWTGMAAQNNDEQFRQKSIQIQIGIAHHWPKS